MEPEQKVKDFIEPIKNCSVEIAIPELIHLRKSVCILERNGDEYWSYLKSFNTENGSMRTFDEE
ncbi:hypothetical protein R5Q34_004547 [Salmonella enterica]|nr:hypothetical protein [Salmonella enterica]